jgi:hypothetical protein
MVKERLTCIATFASTDCALGRSAASSRVGGSSSGRFPPCEIPSGGVAGSATRRNSSAGYAVPCATGSSGSDTLKHHPGGERRHRRQ